MTGNRATLWTSKADCAAWMRQAQQLAAKGPNQTQVERFKNDPMRPRYRGLPQARSGQFYTFCARFLNR